MGRGGKKKEHNKHSAIGRSHKKREKRIAVFVLAMGFSKGPGGGGGTAGDKGGKTPPDGRGEKGGAFRNRGDWEKIGKKGEARHKRGM